MCSSDLDRPVWAKESPGPAKARGWWWATTGSPSGAEEHGDDQADSGADQDLDEGLHSAPPVALAIAARAMATSAQREAVTVAGSSRSANSAI